MRLRRALPPLLLLPHPCAAIDCCAARPPVVLADDAGVYGLRALHGLRSAQSLGGLDPAAERGCSLPHGVHSTAPRRC